MKDAAVSSLAVVETQCLSLVYTMINYQSIIRNQL